jgi:hypothetical protein
VQRKQEGQGRVPRAGHALPRRHRIGPIAQRRPGRARSRATTTWAACPKHIELPARRAPARTLQGRGPRASAKPSASRSEHRLASALPGPGLAVRVLRRHHQGTPRGRCARPTDIVIEEIRSRRPSTPRSGRPSRCFLPVRSVGVMGDGRTYDNVCALRVGRHPGRA